MTIQDHQDTQSPSDAARPAPGAAAGIDSPLFDALIGAP